MTQDIRQQIDELVNRAWALHDKAKTEQEREKYRLDVMNLLSQLPENEVVLRIVQ